MIRIMFISLILFIQVNCASNKKYGSNLGYERNKNQLNQNQFNISTDSLFNKYSVEVFAYNHVNGPYSDPKINSHHISQLFRHFAQESNSDDIILSGLSDYLVTQFENPKINKYLIYGRVNSDVYPYLPIDFRTFNLFLKFADYYNIDEKVYKESLSNDVGVHFISAISFEYLIKTIEGGEKYNYLKMNDFLSELGEAEDEYFLYVFQTYQKRYIKTIKLDLQEGKLVLRKKK